MLRLLKPVLCAASLLMLFGLVIGCGGPTPKSYIPTADLARDALDEALKEWQSGKSHGTLKDFKVPIDVIDTRWQSGKKLESYEILKEEPSDGPKVFAVKMKVTGEKEESEIKYYVVGKSPLFIYAEADYKKDTGM